MLETPLFGRFVGENRRLVFAAAGPYHFLIRATAAVGAMMLVASLTPLDLPVFQEWWLMVGAMLIGAAVLAAFSLQTIVFDLREKTYRRRQGPGWIPRFTRGRVDDLDAIVVLAEHSPSPIAPMVTFHMVLHWKGSKEPIMVLQRQSLALHSNAPINSGAGPFLHSAAQYASALGLRFFDNSYYFSPCPVPLWNA